MSDLIDTTEMYLKVVFELEEQRQPALRARLAERLGQAMPSVSQTVGRLERDGLLTLDDQRIIALTDEGRRLAVAVMRKHRIAERFLFDVLGLDWSECHEEACRWEHVLGDAAESKLAGLIESLDTDPYGNPIPGLVELGRSGALYVRGVPASESVATGEVEIVAVGEGIQADTGALVEFERCGIVPGARVNLSVESGETVLEGSGGRVRLDAHFAAQLFVSA